MLSTALAPSHLERIRLSTLGTGRQIQCELYGPAPDNTLTDGGILFTLRVFLLKGDLQWLYRTFSSTYPSFAMPVTR